MKRQAFTRRYFVAGAAAVTGVSLFQRRSFGSDPTRHPPIVSGLQAWKDRGVIDLSRSKYAKLRTVPVRAVTLHQGFWTPRCKVNVETSIPTMHDLLEQHGRMNNFRRLMHMSSAPQIGKFYSDSDVYKWTEAASFAQQSGDQLLFRDRIDEITKLIQGVQEPSGYLNTYYVDDRAKQRMSIGTQIGGHELFNIGHLIQAAVAQYRSTGDPRLLECCMRFVDNFLIPSYGPDIAKTPIVAGHPEIEMALVELYRVSGDRRHLALAGYILEGDKRVSLTPDQIVYMFCGIPFSSRTKLEGHAVRAMYACCGATDYYLETGDDRYWKALTALWQDLVHDQMYISGGVGARRKNEAFGDPYELPNATAYGESCAAIGNMMWNWRMLHADPSARYTDIIERALYNGINSGMSLSGTTYCYRNPLAFDPAKNRPIRNAWYDTTCCPPNIERTLASLPGYFYSTGKDGLYVHLFHNSTLNWHLETGEPIQVEQRTTYPLDGHIQIIVSPIKPTSFALYVRVPGWAQNATVTVADRVVPKVTHGEYLRIERVWKPGDIVVMELHIAPEFLVADRRVADDYGKVAAQRGPLLYCAESLDLPHATALNKVTLLSGNMFNVAPRPDLLGGVDVLEYPGTIADIETHPDSLYANSSTDTLYTRASAATLHAVSPTDSSQTVPVKLIPYYAWANRSSSEMAVWLPIDHG